MGDALFVYTLLQSSTIANLMTTFTLVSTDYLKYLALTKSSNFDNRYKTTMDCYELVLNYIISAKDTLVADFKGKLRTLPCRNGDYLDKMMSGWEDAFDPTFYDPIAEYKTTMEEFMNGLPSDFFEKAEEYAEGTAGWEGFPPLKSSETKPPKKHSCSVEDLSNERLKVSNGKEVMVWRNPNGGSKGDAHGRWDEDPKPFQFWIGQKVTFVDAHCAAVDCADNYFSQNGDVAGWGEVDGAGNGQRVGNCDECAKLCTARGACKSYECSGTE